MKNYLVLENEREENRNLKIIYVERDYFNYKTVRNIEL